MNDFDSLAAGSSRGDPVTVFVCDDSEVVRLGLIATLERFGNFTIVGSAPDGLSAVEMIAESRPKVVLVDIGMPGMDGLELTMVLKESFPEITVLVISAADDEATLRAALAAGVDGYCFKQTGLDLLLQAVQAVASGASWFAPEFPKRLFGTVADSPAMAPPTYLSLRYRGNHAYALSPREFDVLRLLAEGLTNRQIAERICLSSETVKTHVRHILEKLQVTDRTQAVIKSLREGLLSQGMESAVRKELKLG